MIPRVQPAEELIILWVTRDMVMVYGFLSESSPQTEARHRNVTEVGTQCKPFLFINTFS